MRDLMTPCPLHWDESQLDASEDDIGFAFDDFLENFSAILALISEHGRFYIEGRQMGWRRLSGSLTLSAGNARAFIAAAFPRTAEWSLRGVYEPCHRILTYTLWHHDAPTGEFYTVRAADEPPS